MARGYSNVLISAQTDGPVLTAAAAASCIPTGAKKVLDANYMEIGRVLRLTASGRISCAVTTPGTARFDVRFGSTNVFDGLAMNLNIVAKTDVGWWLEILLTCRAIGGSTTANMIGQGRWTSEALIASPLPTVGGSGVIMLPVASAPAVGGGFDSTATQAVDLFFTQTVATGSLTLHQYMLESLN
jgi:hypothetical protein